MPLPCLHIYGAKRCRARSKHSGKRCLNPAAFGMTTCRMHGARHPHTVLRDEWHPSYKHGHETLKAKAIRSEKLAELRNLEALMFKIGMTKAPKTPGRKPNV
jgi:hypothetical protein